MAVTNNGQGTQSIQLIDPVTEKILDTKIIDRSWYGLAFSNDEKKLYASGGHNNRIEIFSIENKKLTLVDSIVLGKNGRIKSVLQDWPLTTINSGCIL